MLIATFMESSDWSGKSVLFEREQLVIEELGPLSARLLLEYDRRGQLAWAHDGLRGMVAALASAEATAAPPQLSRTEEDPEPTATAAPPETDAAEETLEMPAEARSAVSVALEPARAAHPAVAEKAVGQPQSGVYFMSGDKVAVLPVEVTGAMLGVAKAVVDRSREFNRDRVEQLRAFAERLYEATAAVGPSSTVRLELSGSEEAIVNLLYVQAMARADLPWRIRQQCRTCNQVTVTNPDYERLKSRNKKISGLTRGLGVAIFSGGVSPFFMASSVLGFMKLDPDFVCPACKGLEADESISVYCPDPKCRTRHDEVLLSRCKCGLDFVAGVDVGVIWQPSSSVARPATAGRQLVEEKLAKGLFNNPWAMQLQGGRLATVSVTGSVSLWDVGENAGGEGEPRTLWSAKVDGPPGLAFSLDQQLLAAGGGKKELHLLEGSDGVDLGCISPRIRESITALAFDGAGQRLAVAVGDVELWDISRREHLRTLPVRRKSWVRGVTFSPDGALVAAQNITGVSVWRAIDGEPIQTFDLQAPGGKAARTTALAWRGDQAVTAVGTKTILEVYAVASGERLAQFLLEANARSVALSHDASRVAVSCDSGGSRPAVLVFDVTSGDEVQRITLRSFADQLTFAPDGRLAVVSTDNVLRVWLPDLG